MKIRCEVNANGLEHYVPRNDSSTTLTSDHCVGARQRHATVSGYCSLALQYCLLAITITQSYGLSRASIDHIQVLIWIPWWIPILHRCEIQWSVVTRASRIFIPCLYATLLDGVTPLEFRDVMRKLDRCLMTGFTIRRKSAGAPFSRFDMHTFVCPKEICSDIQTPEGTHHSTESTAIQGGPN